MCECASGCVYIDIYQSMLKVVVCLLTKECVICMQGQTRLSPLSPRETSISIAAHTRPLWHIWNPATQADGDLAKRENVSLSLCDTHTWKPSQSKSSSLTKISGCLHQTGTQCLRRDATFLISVPQKPRVFIFEALKGHRSKLKAF